MTMALARAGLPLRKTKGDSGINYLIKWLSYGPAYNSWEPERRLKQNAPDTLTEYWDKIAAVQAQSLV